MEKNKGPCDSLRRCSKCLEIKSVSEFYFATSRKQYRSQCILCIYPPKNHTCERCGFQWISKGGGRERTGDRCDKCYPYYRQAVTLYHVAKERATKHKLPFDLFIEWLEEQLYSPCPRTGVTFDILTRAQNYRMRSPHAPSIDKIKPSEGYVMNNIQIVCWWYNLAKSQFSDEEVLELCKKVVEQSKVI